MKDKSKLLLIIFGSLAIVTVIVTVVVIMVGGFNNPGGSSAKETTTQETTTEALTVDDYYNLFVEYSDAKDVSMALNYGYMYMDECEDESSLKDMYKKIADIYVDNNNYSAAYNLLMDSEIPGLYEEYCQNVFDLEAYTGFYLDSENEEYYFLGSYPQTGYAEAVLPEYVVNAQFDSNNYAKIYGVEYVRMEGNKGYTYYVYEPVRWWVIGEDEDEYFLLSEVILDSKAFHNSFSAATWDVSDLRTWLNEEFYNNCFNDKDKTVITEHLTPASNNYYYGVVSGADTYNNISSITSASLADGTYLFTDHNSDEMRELRIAKGTDYAIANGLRVYDDNCGKWWTATSADAANLYTVVVTEKGIILIESGGEVNTKKDIGVRPFIIVAKEVN